MKLPKELTTVTPVSKFFALVLFILLPFIGFLFGMNYQAAFSRTDISIQPIYPPQPSQAVMCPTDLRECPDGTWVGREVPNCEFVPCPDDIEKRKTTVLPDISGTDMSACFYYYGALMSDEECKKVPLEARRCNTDADCSASCSRGCISNSWRPPLEEYECMSQPMYGCSCIAGECRRDR